MSYKKLIFIVCTLFCIFTTSLASEQNILEFSGIKEYKYYATTSKKANYFIDAKKRVINTKIEFSLNLQDTIRKNSYYEDGVLHVSDKKVKFQRAYMYSKKLYMSKCSGEYNGMQFHAKNGIKYDSYILFDRITFKSKKITKIRNNYKLYI
jgi:hypothetical protein